ncbi:sel1 repeat family protein [Acinetobacter bereziniae]|nr:sel1 repeat family protein [Acinetobacter bereziniae]MCU4597802.1 sel1 repeat family protein [Acinetobacter bereziniae]RSZ25683.1 sel1 repeat family protein [Acinetobacter bereziniae]
MGTRMTGMVFPFQGDIQEIKTMIYTWMQHEVEIIESYTTIRIELIHDNFVIIDNIDIFYSAYNHPELWQELVVDLPFNDWIIFFECVDSCDSYSYLIYKNNHEVRRMLQEEDEDLYFEGEVQDFEKVWLDFSIYYEHEYVENGKIKKEKITDPKFSLEHIEDHENYFKYYHITLKNQTMYHTRLARVLMVEMFEHFLGFDIIDGDCKVKQSLKIDYNTIPAYDRILKRAEKNDVPAQNELGMMYEQGHGVEQDIEKARYWYQKTANQNDHCGQLHLGLLFKAGKGVEKDLEEALQWISKAATNGNADALTVLGEMYELGEGVEQSFAEAAILYRKAAKQRHAVAPYKLGLMYEYGYGFAADIKMAMRWYYQAASHFNEDAQKRLDELRK